MTSHRPRVLLIAEAANPEWVSVPLIGWSQYAALAEIADAHLVTQVRNREAVVRAGRVEGRDFTSIDSEWVAAPFHRLSCMLRGGNGKGWTTVAAFSSLAYYAFEQQVWKRFRDQLRGHSFDLVHRLTPLSPATPSLLARRCATVGVPFILGPLNGGLSWPPGFAGERRREREWLSYLRAVHKLLPAYHATRRYAQAILVASRETWRQLPKRYHDRCVYLPENAVDPDRFKTVVDRPIERPIRVAFLGRLVPCKGVDMLLTAAAPLVRSGQLVIDVIGDGPEMPRLRQIVQHEKLDARVRLDGWVKHHALPERLARSDVLGFPSVRDFGGGAVLEAMVSGLVPVVVDYGGPGELVSSATGYRIPMGTRDEIVAGLRSVLEELAAQPETIRPMGARARRRAFALFTWRAKARQLLEVYRWVLGQRGDKPDFGMPFPDGPESQGDEHLLTRCGSGSITSS